MRLIGVIDLLGGRAVHARAGTRESYAPLTRAASAPLQPGDARALARAYVGQLGLDEMYIADLDAIAGHSTQTAIVDDIALLGVPIWLDAGIRTVDEARRAIDRRARRVVVGLETLPSFATLAAICDGVRPLESSRVKGSDPIVAFSLDLRDGEPVVMKTGDIPAGQTPEALAARAATAGVRTLIVLDLARVGTGRGIDVSLLERVRLAAPDLRLIAGGGVRGWDDLVQLADAGCDGALVATALHDGRITAAEISAARGLVLHR